MVDNYRTEECRQVTEDLGGRSPECEGLRKHRCVKCGDVRSQTEGSLGRGSKGRGKQETKEAANQHDLDQVGSQESELLAPRPR